MPDRVILHVDLNSFFASVETVLNPALRGRAVAVCGSEKERHGIVLAKSELAKQAGVKTGMTNGEAKKLCPDLIVVPPRYRYYALFSGLAKKIYLRYTNFVEPFGLDENWLDMTDGIFRYESPLALADEIRETVSRELGLTVSVGVSFSKVFAKLASDMKKPDAVTLITRENYKTRVWRLPVEDLLFVGRSTAARLHRYAIHTIGDLARADEGLIRTLLGKNGVMLRAFADGRDNSRVADFQESVAPKSIGHGITCSADVTDEEEVFRIFLELAQEIGRQLRAQGFWAGGVQIAVKDPQRERTRKRGVRPLPREVQIGTPPPRVHDSGDPPLADPRGRPNRYVSRPARGAATGRPRNRDGRHHLSLWQVRHLSRLAPSEREDEDSPSVCPHSAERGTQFRGLVKNELSRETQSLTVDSPCPIGIVLPKQKNEKTGKRSRVYGSSLIEMRQKAFSPKKIKKRCPRATLFMLLKSNVEQTEDLFVEDHANQVRNPKNPPAEEDTNDPRDDLPFLDARHDAANPSGNRDDSQNQANNPVESKVIRFPCHDDSDLLS